MSVPELSASPIPYKSSAKEKNKKFLNRIRIKKILAITIEDKDRTFSLPILSAKYPAGSNPSMILIF